MDILSIDKLVKKRPGETEILFRERTGRFASLIGVFSNIILSVLKVFVGVISGSIAVIGDAVNNISDIISYVIAFISFKVSSRPADREHPFGHARFEYVASLFVSFVIIVVAYKLGASSIERIGNDEKIVYPVIAVVFLGISVLVKLWLFFVYRRLANKLNSSVLRASAADCISDVISSSVILLSIAASLMFDMNTDGYMGLFASAFILYAAFKIIRESLDKILGMPDNDSKKEKVYSIARSFKGVYGIHDIIVHDYGFGRCYCTLHAEVKDITDIKIGHEIADGIEREVKNELGYDCIVHIDPVETDSADYEKAASDVETALAETNAALSVHDLRLVRNPDKITLVFDISAPFEIKTSDSEIIDTITEKLSSMPEKYHAVITVDRE